MINLKNFKSEIFSLQSNQFEDYALLIFQYQFQHNLIYNEYCTSLNKTPDTVQSLHQIPFLPIEFFKTQKVVTGTWEPEKIFQSSGTTGQSKSHHYVKDLGFYHKIARSIFEDFYGPLSDFEILALLPSYQQQGNSSLISMVDYFMNQASIKSNYYLGNSKELSLRLNSLESKNKLLIGVSFALLDLLEASFFDIGNLIVMETGGMKGRRKEIIRPELHQMFQKGFGVPAIHSEYGMSELTSQAYGLNGYFKFPKWAKVLIRDINDPFHYMDIQKTGGVNIIDLANLHTCAFIETKDLGRQLTGDTFEILGRFDNSDIRGCNLLATEQ